MLRMHGIIRKVLRTHRYQVTDKGRLTITALLATARANATVLDKGGFFFVSVFAVAFAFGSRREACWDLARGAWGFTIRLILALDT